jgi:hypothetical protein
MGQKAAVVHTKLSTKQCAELFQQTAERSRGIGSRLGGFAAQMTGKDQSGYFTPTDDSPFSLLDDDKPNFSVGVLIPKFNAGGQGNAAALHMYVWDRGESREVRLISPHNFGGGAHASRLVGKAVETFRVADPSSRASVQ